MFKVKVDNESSVVISGSTNINSFDCEYAGKYQSDSLVISGSIDGRTLKMNGAKFKLDVYQFDCGISLMTSEFQETLMAEKFPEITMEISKAVFINEESYKERETYVDTYIVVNVAGQTKTYKIKTQRKLANKAAHFIGCFDIMVEDFDITPPSKAFGLVNVNSELTINYFFIFNT